MGDTNKYGRSAAACMLLARDIWCAMGFVVYTLRKKGRFDIVVFIYNY